VVPPECRLTPVDPEPVDEVLLPPLPVETAPDYLAVRTKRAELAGLFYQGQRDAEKAAREANAKPQLKCAEWSKLHTGN
jgi:hypothetical protein